MRQEVPNAHPASLIPRLSQVSEDCIRRHSDSLLCSLKINTVLMENAVISSHLSCQTQLPPSTNPWWDLNWADSKPCYLSNWLLEIPDFPFFFFPPPSHFYSIVFFNYTQGSFHHLPHQIFLSKYEWWLNIQKTLCSGHIVISIPCARRKRIKPSLPSHLLNMLCQCKKSILLYKLQEQCIYLPCWNSVAFHWK